MLVRVCLWLRVCVTYLTVSSAPRFGFPTVVLLCVMGFDVFTKSP